MSFMFYGCSSLNLLNISNFNTQNVANMGYMFYECSSLKDLIFSWSHIIIYNIHSKDTEGVCDKCPKLEPKAIENYSSFFYTKHRDKINLRIFILNN